jgi:hypothetical protein
MRVYHERLRVPISWWLLGLTAVLLLAAELAAGLPWPAVAGIYAGLAGGCAAALARWGWVSVEVAGGELRAGRSGLPLAAAGEVAALDEAQTRALRGPRADPAAIVLVRPYLRRAVYVEVTAGVQGEPYWLVGTRHPAELAAAISSARPAAPAGEPLVG